MEDFWERRCFRILLSANGKSSHSAVVGGQGAENQVLRDGTWSSGHEHTARVVSLGSWCGVKIAIKALGLDNKSLPMDWTRISMEGLLHTLRTDFTDYLKHDYITHQL